MTVTCHSCRPRHRGRNVRPGMLLMEAAAALALLAMLVISLARLLAASTAAERYLTQQAVRQQHASNLLRRISMVPWEQLNQQQAEQIAQQYAQQTDQPHLTIRVTQQNDPVVLKRIEVMTSAPTSGAGAEPAARRLVYWSFPRSTEQQMAQEVAP